MAIKLLKNVTDPRPAHCQHVADYWHYRAKQLRLGADRETTDRGHCVRLRERADTYSNKAFSYELDAIGWEK